MKSLTLALSLPFMLALALGMHALVARVIKVVYEAARPLSSAEPEALRYERRVYATAQPAMWQIVGLVLVAGLLFWVGMGWGQRAGWWLGGLVVAGAIALDLWCWQRVSVSANYLWAQNGVGGELQQVAIENIGELSVQEDDAVGGFTLRHGNNNRLCRLQVRLNSGEPVELPWTDAHAGLDEVEAMANHLRARQMIRGDRQSLQQATDQAADAARLAAQQSPSQDAELRRELRRLRQGALAPDVPKAVSTRQPED